LAMENKANIFNAGFITRCFRFAKISGTKILQNKGFILISLIQFSYTLMLD